MSASMVFWKEGAVPASISSVDTGPRRRAFPENLVWGAVEQKPPVWYCALHTGTQRVWERMIVTFASLLGEPVLPEELWAAARMDDVVDRVGRVDAVLVRNVLPHLWLRDPVGAGYRGSHDFLAGLDARLH